MTARTIAWYLIAALLFAGTGCFKSSTSQASSESSSDSVSSPFKWSSKSSDSSSDDDESAMDVRDATELWVREGDDVDAFRRDVGRITESHGVTDWESDPRTYDAIGRGLRRAEIEEASARRLSAELVAGDARALAWIWRGYGSEQVN